MDEEIEAERRRKRREYMQKYYDSVPGEREKTRERRRAYIERLKAEGKYEDFKRGKAEYEKRRRTKDTEYHKLKDSEKHARWRREHWDKAMLRNARSRAIKKGLPFDLVAKDIVVPDVCPVLGISIDKSLSHMKDHSPSLDRIKPELGYVKGNIRVISQRANRLKCDGTAAEMLLVYQDLLRIEAL